MAVDLEVDGALERIRDYVGEDEPTNGVLYGYAEELNSWQAIALRVLRRRRASVAAGGDDPSLAIPGVISIGASKSNLAALDADIATLEAEIAALNGEAVGVSVRVMSRPDRHR